MRLFRLFRFFVASRATLARIPSLLGDARVPLGVKLLALLGVLLVLSPLNVFGDIPLIGVADDIALLGLLANWFVRTAESHTVRPIDGEIVPGRG